MIVGISSIVLLINCDRRSLREIARITIYVKEFQSRIERNVAGLAKIYEGIEKERSETNRELALAVFKIYCPSDQQAESRNAFCLHAKYCQSTDHA